MVPPSRAGKNFILIIILIVGTLMCAFSSWDAYRANGGFGFPLDDSWIHLQFARNLHDYGSYSYYKNDMVTSGSTSPLYTLFLTGGYFVTKDEMLVSYVLGVAFLVLAGIYLFKLCMVDFQQNVFIAIGAVILLLFEPRLQWIALSGMETTLFILLLLAATYYYKIRHEILLGITSGLLLWTRPEALIFIAALLIDVWYHDYLVKSRQFKQTATTLGSDLLWWLRRMLIVFLIFGSCYVGFNLWLSGSVFPNTVAAKITYYSRGTTDFPDQVFRFLTESHLSILWYLCGIEIISLLYALIRLKPHNLFLGVLWGGGMFLAYWNNLPYLYQEGRYLMPILPFAIVLGLGGMYRIVVIAKRLVSSVFTDKTANLLTACFLLVFIGQFAVASWNHRIVYAEYCKYITDRQVRAAKWIHDNLPADAVVATHDIGAIAYYSGRRIVDMVGLISPEMIENIGSLDRLHQFLVKQKTTHLAVLRNWFEIVNVNPIFQTDERNPEIMEVFVFDPARVHFTPQNASRFNDLAVRHLSMGNVQQAAALIKESLRLDPASSKTLFLLGRVQSVSGELEKAESSYRGALQLHPSLWAASLGLAELAMKRNDPHGAVAKLKTLLAQNPAYAPGYRALADIYASSLKDSIKASEYREKYNKFSQTTR